MIGKLEHVLERKVMDLERMSTKELLRRSVKAKNMKPVNDAAAQAVCILQSCSSSHLARIRTLPVFAVQWIAVSGWFGVRDMKG